MNDPKWLGVFIALTSATAGLAQGTNNHQAEVQRLAKPLVDGRLVPGLVVGLYDDGKLETYGLGVVSKERSVPPGAKTIYEIGSISKVFTSLLLAEAITRKEVTLDTTLSQLLPAGIKAPKREGKEITLELLATHFSGLPRLPNNMTADSLVNPYADYGRVKLFAFLNGYQLTRLPGAEHQYSNLGMGLLGTLLSDKAHLGYDKLLHERITVPLGMVDTTVRLTTNQQSRLAPPHHGGVRVSNWDFQALAGCGAVRSTADDLLKFIDAHVNSSSSPLKTSIQLASKHRRAIPGIGRSMALGWMVGGDGSTLWHTGQTGGYSSAVFVNPSFKKGSVVLANGADSAVDVLGERLFQMLIGMKVEPPKVRPSILLPETQLNRLLGEYVSTAGFTIKITRSDESLQAQLTGQVAMPIQAESPTKFFYRDVEAEIKFEVDPKTDRATALTHLQNGKEFRCSRK